MMPRYTCWALLLMVAPALGLDAWCAPFTGKITGVSSGNILKADDGCLLLLYGIKDYEPGSEKAAAAKEFLKRNVLSGSISVEMLGAIHGIQYIKVTLPDGGDLSGQMISRGLAEWDSVLWPEARQLGKLQKEWSAQSEAKRKDVQKAREAEQTDVERKLRQAKDAEEQRKRAEAWQKEVDAWRKTSSIKRCERRVRLVNLSRKIETELQEASEFYNDIKAASQLVALGRDSLADVNRIYSQILRVQKKRSYQVEEQLIKRHWDQAEATRVLNEGVRAYRELAARIDEESSFYESEQQKLTHLDAELPAEAIETDRKTAAGNPPFEAGDSRTGTGFVVAKGGYVLTCAHVIKDAQDITVQSRNGSPCFTTVEVCRDNDDWAILHAPDLVGPPPIPVATDTPKVGSTIYCLGYPLSGLLSNATAVAGSGIVAALEGIEGDTRHIQVTVAINSGNSGSPILNNLGQWVGMASHKLSDLAGLKLSGAVPQGLNFAVKASCIHYNSNNCSFARVDGLKEMPLEQLAEKLSWSIVRVVARAQQ